MMVVACLGVPYTWERVSTSSGTGPSGRRYPCVGYDSGRNRLIVFGGFDGTDALDDTWALNLTDGSWSSLPSGPPARFGAVFAVDQLNEQFLVAFGFRSDGTSVRNDMWAFDLTTSTWNSAGINGQDRVAHSAFGISLAINDTLVVTHGVDNSGTALDTTQSVNVNGITGGPNNVWTDRTPSSSLPSARTKAAFAATPESLLMVGGLLQNGSAAENVVWIADLASSFNWTSVSYSTGPLSVDSAGMSIVENLDNPGVSVVMFGGSTGTTQNGDTWLYSISDGTWTSFDPNGASSPSRRDSHVMTFVSPPDAGASPYVLLFGGRQGSNYYNDVWMLTGDALPTETDGDEDGDGGGDGDENSYSEYEFLALIPFLAFLCVAVASAIGCLFAVFTLRADPIPNCVPGFPTYDLVPRE